MQSNVHTLVGLGKAQERSNDLNSSKNNESDISIIEIIFGLFCVFVYVALCLYVSVVFYVSVLNHNYIWSVVSVVLFVALTVGIRWALPKASKDFKEWLNVRSKSV
ncbi:hypothetical protein [Bacillus changyiensis]|uniref:hypothetical protein n=1 Tax=Bacillus changyiensis TaxID=3004103 RepID=UPI0022DF56EE|nr:hypothetical protein [Bacillus changyiensis]